MRERNSLVWLSGHTFCAKCTVMDIKDNGEVDSEKKGEFSINGGSNFHRSAQDVLSN